MKKIIITRHEAPAVQSQIIFARPRKYLYDTTVIVEHHKFALADMPTQEMAIQCGQSTLYAIEQVGVLQYEHLCEQEKTYELPAMPKGKFYDIVFVGYED